MVNEYILNMKNISKKFPGVQALDDVDLELKKGEVLALLGENGAGKSTLLKIMTGVKKTDSGSIKIDGKQVDIKNPHDASNKGLSIVYQELNYIDELSIAENIFLGRLPKKKFGWVNWKKLKKDTEDILHELDFDINPLTLMNNLSIAEKQLVEIAKAISKDIRVLIMDEPTSALNNKETEHLLKLIRTMADEKEISVIYVSHRINEIFIVADRVMVMRDGKRVGVKKIKDVSIAMLIKMMVGRDVNSIYERDKIKKGEVVFRTEKLNSKNIKDISINIRQGELLGIFGLMGSGTTNIAKTILGLEKSTSGEIIIDGEKVTISTPKQAFDKGIAYLPSERKNEGLILGLNVKENITLPTLKDIVSKLGWLKSDAESKICKGWIKKLNIKTPSINTIINSLSGGNQQKVVLAKWLAANPKVLILNEPTRGIDVGAKEEIYAIIENLCKQGLGVVMITSELPELIAMSDRIVVIGDGEIRAQMDNNDLTQENIMEYAI